MTVHEKQGPGAVTGNDQSATVRFWITTTAPHSWSAAYNELYAASVGGGAFASFNGIPAQTADVDEVSERLGYWNGEVNYSFDTPRGSDPSTTPQPELELSFDTSVRPTLERWRSDGPGWTYPTNPATDIIPATGEPAVDHDGLGYGGIEKGYEGIQIPRPESSFNLEYSPVSLSQAELVAISRAVGTVNLNAFYTWNAGELLLAGARGQSKKNDRWRLSYQFFAKSNRTNVDCGNGITVAAVDGWDIIEVEYKRTTINITGPPAVTKTVERARQARRLRPFTRLPFEAILFP